MDRDLRSQLVLALTMRRMAELSGGRVRTTHGVTRFDGAPPGPGPWAGAVRTNPSVPAAELLERAARFFAASPRAYTVMTSSNLDADVEELLTQQEQEPVDDGAAMWTDLPPEPPEPPALVRLAPVRDDDARAGFCHVGLPRVRLTSRVARARGEYRGV